MLGPPTMTAPSFTFDLANPTLCNTKQSTFLLACQFSHLLLTTIAGVISFESGGGFQEEELLHDDAH